MSTLKEFIFALWTIGNKMNISKFGWDGSQEKEAVREEGG